MTAPEPSLTEPVIVSTLRAAGCVFAEDEARLLVAEAGSGAELAELVARRVSGVPLEHVLGWAEFCGLRVAVDPGVFVPRRRTELMVAQAVAVSPPAPVVVDLCCGSGAAGAAFAAAVPGLQLYAADLDPAATACARKNILPPGHVLTGDLFDALPETLRGRVDVLMANVPYVPTEAIATMPPEARLHEAAMALDGGGDGLDVLRRVAIEAPDWLAPGGTLLVESSGAQATVAADCLATHGLLPRVVQDDEIGATVVLGKLPGAPAGKVSRRRRA